MLREVIGSSFQGLEQAGKRFIQRITVGYTKNEVLDVLGKNISPTVRQRFFTDKIQAAGTIAFYGTVQPDISGISYMLAAHRAESDEANRLNSLSIEKFDQELTSYILHRAQLFGL